MRKLLVLLATGVVAVTMSLTGAHVVSAAPTHAGQYNPTVPTTAPGVQPTVAKGTGVDQASTNTGALPQTGSDSKRLAGQGAALVVAGIGAILVRRRYAARP